MIAQGPYIPASPDANEQQRFNNDPNLNQNGKSVVSLPSQTESKSCPVWPDNAQDMNNFLGVPGISIPDTPGTPGRNKVVWDLGFSTITFEQHPYHTNAPPWHSGPHWHLDTPGNPHKRYLPGDPIPGGK